MLCVVELQFEALNFLTVHVQGIISNATAVCVDNAPWKPNEMTTALTGNRVGFHMIQCGDVGHIERRVTGEFNKFSE